MSPVRGSSLPSELLLLSPRPARDVAFQELARRLAPIISPTPVRIVYGDGCSDSPPARGAGLVAGGGEATRRLLDSMRLRNRRGSDEPLPGWSWVHLTSSGPDPFAEWGRITGDPLRTYSRGVNARGLAEWILAVTLFFHRDLGFYLEMARSGGWERRIPRELQGRTMVILGAGSAGTEAARAGAALGLQSIGVSRTGRTLPGFDRVVPARERDEVLGLGDVTVVLLPRTAETLGSIGAVEIARLRPGSLLLVLSRGGIVDEDAVLEAVVSGHLAGAAFDVFAREPLPADSPLRAEPRILLTPHVAGSSDRFMERTSAILECVWRSRFLGEEPERVEFYRFCEGGTR